jgi:hypothetical protein
MDTETQGKRMAGEMVVDGYEALRAHLTDIVASGKIRAQMAVEREKVRAYWEMGQVLHGYLLDAPYEHGAHVVARLSGDLRIGRRTVYGIMEFYEKFPGVRAGAQLTWTHYRRLCALPTLRLRRAYLNAAEAEGWSVRDLTAAIKAKRVEQGQIGARPSPVSGVFSADYGTLHTYAVSSTPTGERRLDLGFGVRNLVAGLDGVGADEMVVSEGVDGGYAFRAVSFDRRRLYTFAARVLRVVDGDTLLVDVDLGFGIWVAHRLRLRGIDTPELPTAAGRRAQTFVQAALAKGSVVVLQTHRTDKYGRYLADVRYLAGTDDGGEVLASGRDLQADLLASGLAVGVGR